jgi:A/G-specific adenine glycosylase
MQTEKKYFTKKLLQWNKNSNRRLMPWKGEKDPYKIWLSEIILQQTRVDQGWGYYNRFVQTFASVNELAAAADNKVFKLWEGLGYYSRCKNLLATARVIVKDYQGIFPAQYEDILKLKGVGPYTAAAIASFAFNLPYAVVDGNVFRVLSRFFGNATPIDSTTGKKVFALLANELLDKKEPGLYNQAIMDFGATVCKPQLPLCPTCPLHKKCVSFIKQITEILPVKEKKVIQKKRWFYYVVAVYGNKVLVHKRSAKDIWENLYEFVLYERTKAITINRLKKLPGLKQIANEHEYTIKSISGVFRQKLTHQVIEGRFVTVILQCPPLLNGYKLVSLKQLAKVPFPKFITTFLKDKNVSLNLK